MGGRGELCSLSTLYAKLSKRRERMTSHATQLSLPAIGLIVASTACFTATDTAVKHLGQSYPVPLLVWARWGMQALLMVVLFGPKMRWRLLRTAKPKLQFIRGVTLIVASLCFFTALKFLPLAEATALNYSSPILVTLMAGWMLRERITRPRCLRWPRRRRMRRSRSSRASSRART